MDNQIVLSTSDRKRILDHAVTVLILNLDEYDLDTIFDSRRAETEEGYSSDDFTLAEDTLQVILDEIENGTFRLGEEEREQPNTGLYNV